MLHLSVSAVAPRRKSSSAQQSVGVLLNKCPRSCFRDPSSLGFPRDVLGVAVPTVPMSCSAAPRAVQQNCKREPNLSARGCAMQLEVSTQHPAQLHNPLKQSRQDGPTRGFATTHSPATRAAGREQEEAGGTQRDEGHHSLAVYSSTLPQTR